MRNQYAKRTDGNQEEVVNTLRRAGYPVYLTFRLGCGFPDLLVCSKSEPPQNILAEVKQTGEELTPDEEKFFAGWPGPKLIVYSGQDAVDKMARFDVAHGINQ